MIVSMISGYVTANIKKSNVNDGRVVFNFGLGVEDGYGDAKQNIFYNCALFAKKGKQEEFYERLLVKGRRVMCEGKIKPGKPYEKNGVQIVPWGFVVSRIDSGISQTFVSGRLSDDAVVATKEDRVIVRFTVAVDRTKSDAPADFIRCIRFGKGGLENYAKEYLKKGKKIGVLGRIQTGSYLNKDNVKINTSELIVEDFELYEKKDDSMGTVSAGYPTIDPDYPPELNDAFADIDFMDIPMSDEDELPFD